MATIQAERPVRPTDLVGRRFALRRRGFDPDEVSRFLTEIADQLGRLQGQVEYHRARAAMVEERAASAEEAAYAGLAHRFSETLRAADEALGRARARAEAEARVMLEGARRQADRLVASARQEADRVLSSARTDAEGILAAAGSRGDEVVVAAREEADRIAEEVSIEVEDMRGSARRDADQIRKIAREDAERIRAEARIEVEQLSRAAAAEDDAVARRVAQERHPAPWGREKPMETSGLRPDQRWDVPLDAEIDIGDLDLRLDASLFDLFDDPDGS